MGVCIGQASSALHAPYGIEPADHMSAIENCRDIEFRAVDLSCLRYARIRLPSRTLETKKKGAAVDIDTR